MRKNQMQERQVNKKIYVAALCIMTVYNCNAVFGDDDLVVAHVGDLSKIRRSVSNVDRDLARQDTRLDNAYSSLRSLRLAGASTQQVASENGVKIIALQAQVKKLQEETGDQKTAYEAQVGALRSQFQEAQRIHAQQIAKLQALVETLVPADSKTAKEREGSSSKKDRKRRQKKRSRRVRNDAKKQPPQKTDSVPRRSPRGNDLIQKGDSKALDV